MRGWLVILSCLLLAACYPPGKRGGAEALAIYDLGPSVVTAASPTRFGDVAIEVRAPLWMDGLGINYRLAYAEPARLRDYTRARWAGPPAQLVEQRLIRRLGARPAGQGGTACVLRIDIDEFAQVFSDPRSSRGHLQGRAQLLDRRRLLLQSHDFRIETAAPTADSRGGVTALTAAIDQLGSELVAWRQANPSSGSASVCQG